MKPVAYTDESTLAKRGREKGAETTYPQQNIQISSCSDDMSFRFQKRIKILPGLRLNVSKTGISWTVGTRGASVTARDSKLTGNVGIPGTGLSYRKRLDLPSQDQVDQDQSRPPPATSTPSWLVLAVVLGLGILIGLSLR